MGKTTYKALNFDFDIHLIQDNLNEMELEGSYRKAYYAISKYLQNNGFSHKQESAYTSDNPMSFQKIKDLIGNLTEEIPYLENAIKSMQVTSVGRTYEVTELLQIEHNLEIVKPENLYKLESDYEIELDSSLKGLRSIRFDFSGEMLKEKFVENEIDLDTTVAYDWVKKYFTELGYSHEQGSVYKTPSEKTDLQILTDLLKFSEELPYLAESFKSVQVTDVGRTFDLTKIANGTIKETVIGDENIRIDEIQTNNENNLVLK